MRKLTVGPGERDNLKFGELLQKFRTNLAISRREISYRVGISPEYLRLMERGERTPALGTAIKLLEVLSIPYKRNGSQIIFENTSVEFTSRIKEARHRLLDLNRNEMIGEIVICLVNANDETLKKILSKVS